MQSKVKQIERMEQPDNLKKRREFYSLVLIITPTILIGITAQYISNVFVKAITFALLLFFQGVIVRGMIENKD